MSDISAMRKRLRLAFPGPNWDARVTQMSDKQVAFLFKKYTNERKI